MYLRCTYLKVTFVCRENQPELRGLKIRFEDVDQETMDQDRQAV
jgi:hypothetical protein